MLLKELTSILFDPQSPMENIPTLYELQYTDSKGIFSTRTIRHKGIMIYWGSPIFSGSSKWVLRAYDITVSAYRDFSISDISSFRDIAWKVASATDVQTAIGQSPPMSGLPTDDMRTVQQKDCHDQ